MKLTRRYLEEVLRKEFPLLENWTPLEFDSPERSVEIQIARGLPHYWYYALGCRIEYQDPDSGEYLALHDHVCLSIQGTTTVWVGRQEALRKVLGLPTSAGAPVTHERLLRMGRRTMDGSLLHLYREGDQFALVRKEFFNSFPYPWNRRAAARVIADAPSWWPEYALRTTQARGRVGYTLYKPAVKIRRS